MTARKSEASAPRTLAMAVTGPFLLALLFVLPPPGNEIERLAHQLRAGDIEWLEGLEALLQLRREQGRTADAARVSRQIARALPMEHAPNLTAGLHEISVEYVEITGSERLVVHWRPPGQSQPQVLEGELKHVDVVQLLLYKLTRRPDDPQAAAWLQELGYKADRLAPEPIVKLHKLGESSVDFVVWPWAKTEDYFTVYWDVTREVKMRFDREGISIPFPQRDVHLIKENRD